jgi:hypothetical protein
VCVWGGGAAGKRGGGGAQRVSRALGRNRKNADGLQVGDHKQLRVARCSCWKTQVRGVFESALHSHSTRNSRT